jgi:hypothetical protein
MLNKKGISTIRYEKIKKWCIRLAFRYVHVERTVICMNLL